MLHPMRRYIDILLEGRAAPPSDEREPYIKAHRGQHIVEIEMMWVPKAQRGRGVGRRVYEEWEARLPPDVHLVTLFAADTGSGLAAGFWERMGFEYRYTNPEDWPVSEDAMNWMMKGVNGHPTPEPIEIERPDDYEDDYED